ncbi:hypothetical protein DS843_02070 [Roseomonas genomospecies 6]|uniref:Uncharacterized protein n=1 Tax=Roseomonas genomospecies 6 TaxID=214106 RepID=A0A9W7U1C6_9PROT|nr:hypothetical protein DS843_02070 [Roseomonas genomospecies 6]
MTSGRLMLLCHNVHRGVAAATQSKGEGAPEGLSGRLVNGGGSAGTAKSLKPPEIRHIFC